MYFATLCITLVLIQAHLLAASYQWIECRGPNMPAPRASCAGVVYGNDLLILGGRSFSTAVPYLSMTIHAFDIGTHHWHPSLPIGSSCLPSLQRKRCGEV